MKLSIDQTRAAFQDPLASFVKNSCLFILLTLLSGNAFAQQELQVHHINIENGDATMIGIYDIPSHRYISKTLIDGGMSKPGDLLLPYLHKVAGADTSGTHFNYIILTHYHTDHYNGLLAMKTGELTADSLVDPGGYDFQRYFPNQPALQQLTAAHPDVMLIPKNWTNMLSAAMALQPAAIRGHSQLMVSFTNNEQSGIGHQLVLGKIGDLPVTLECVAGWGNTRTGRANAINPMPGDSSENNFTLSFLLRCGEFRYFIGGDLAGVTNSQYIDQEEPLSGYFAIAVPLAHPISGQGNLTGHICGFKADHHGSKTSNVATFMQAMTPSIVVTSAGNKKGWHLPNELFLTRLVDVHAASETTGNPGRGLYFTNLYDWGTGMNSLTKAKNLFAGKPGISFDYGNNNGHKAGYVIRVKPGNLRTESDFEVDRVDISQTPLFSLLASYRCHHQ
ncbi:MBL fold metallo-hydrolase [Mucilaginibacter angelicae]|uniref:MBL fold metallo-hydrolase n=1 Tax=Mucilaginibacter angelicae TaxID=869718 RepID=A0ABV6L5B6_9SPHI